MDDALKRLLDQVAAKYPPIDEIERVLGSDEIKRYAAVRQAEHEAYTRKLDEWVCDVLPKLDPQWCDYGAVLRRLPPDYRAPDKAFMLPDDEADITVLGKLIGYRKFEALEHVLRLTKPSVAVLNMPVNNMRMTPLCELAVVWSVNRRDDLDDPTMSRLFRMLVDAGAFAERKSERDDMIRYANGPLSAALRHFRPEPLEMMLHPSVQWSDITLRTFMRECINFGTLNNETWLHHQNATQRREYYVFLKRVMTLLLDRGVRIDPGRLNTIARDFGVVDEHGEPVMNMAFHALTLSVSRAAPEISWHNLLVDRVGFRVDAVYTATTLIDEFLLLPTNAVAEVMKTRERAEHYLLGLAWLIAKGARPATSRFMAKHCMRVLSELRKAAMMQPPYDRPIQKMMFSTFSGLMWDAYSLLWSHRGMYGIFLIMCEYARGCAKSEAPMNVLPPELVRNLHSFVSVTKWEYRNLTRMLPLPKWS